MIDTHSHIYDKSFQGDLQEVLQRAKDAGVVKIFLPNENEQTIVDVLRVCEANKNFCYPMTGLHPECVNDDYQHRLHALRKLFEADHPFIAIGEVGMDLYWDKTYRKKQQEALTIQVQWALEYDLPLMIHCREAYPELFEVIRPYKNDISGVFHCFSGTMEEAEALLDYPGFMLGVNGILTFKKSTLPQVLRTVPLERIVLETDSPYLAPVPHRGQRNESAFVRDTALKLSVIYECDISQIDTITTKNTLKVFKRLSEVGKVC